VEAVPRKAFCRVNPRALVALALPVVA